MTNPKDTAARDKACLSVLPLVGLMEASVAITEGRRKYAPWNWRDQHVDEVVYIDAAVRHLLQFLAGEDIDPDSGLPHISKAIAGLLILRDAQAHGTSNDNREVLQNVDWKGLAELNAQNRAGDDPVPTHVDFDHEMQEFVRSTPGATMSIIDDETGEETIIAEGVRIVPSLEDHPAIAIIRKSRCPVDEVHNLPAYKELERDFGELEVVCEDDGNYNETCTVTIYSELTGEEVEIATDVKMDPIHPLQEARPAPPVQPLPDPPYTDTDLNTPDPSEPFDDVFGNPMPPSLSDNFDDTKWPANVQASSELELRADKDVFGDQVQLDPRCVDEALSDDFDEGGEPF